mgnify:CR=1 FL=1
MLAAALAVSGCGSNGPTSMTLDDFVVGVQTSDGAVYRFVIRRK